MPERNIEQETDPDSPTAVVRWKKPTATTGKEQSDLVILTSSHKPGDSFPIGITKVWYIADDTLSNVVTATFNVTVTGIFPWDNFVLSAPLLWFSM